MATSRSASTAAARTGALTLGWREEEEEDAPNADAEDWANDTAEDDKATGAVGSITDVLLLRDSCGGRGAPAPKADVRAGRDSRAPAAALARPEQLAQRRDVDVRLVPPRERAPDGRALVEPGALGGRSDHLLHGLWRHERRVLPGACPASISAASVSVTMAQDISCIDISSVKMKLKIRWLSGWKFGGVVTA